MSEGPGVTDLKEQLAEEESIYADLLAEIDRLAGVPTPYESAPELPQELARLNESWRIEPATPPALPSGWKGALRRPFRRLLEPELAALRSALSAQQAFNSQLVQLLNRQLDAAERRGARLAALSSALVRFAQRIDRLADAKDRLYASLESSRTDLLLEAMDKRLESVDLGLRRARARVEGLSTSVELARSEVAALRHRVDGGGELAERSAPAAPPPEGDEEAHYVAFENRFRGSPEEIRERLSTYVPCFEACAPVLELGCGRGEFLELLRDAGIEARGIDLNPEMVELCRERGLSAERAELGSYLRALPADSVGGLFAAQVVEHLPPAGLRETLADCHRAVRREGRVVLETVNPRSVVALIESFYRDLSHQKPLHPETLEFLLRACGFREIEIRYASPVSERAKLIALPPESEAYRSLNENFRKLNAFLFGEQDYAAIATK